MRSPHNPEPTLNLGDDPDLGAELGSRLAASSQTAQGLLTNYLFYGQRRSGTGQGAAATDLSRGLAHEQSTEGARSAEVGHSAQTADHSRTETRGALDAAFSGEGSLPTGVPDRVGRPKLRLILRSERRSREDHKQSSDPLAIDSLGEDPLDNDALSKAPIVGTSTAQPGSTRGPR